MTLFSAIIRRLGLSQAEAAAYLGSRLDTVKAWSSGRNNVPPGALVELWALADKQEAAAQEELDLWDEQGCPPEIEIGVSADDHEAQSLGWPCAGAHMAIIARIWEGLPHDVKVIPVPHGSTPATAAAADVREKR